MGTMFQKGCKWPPPKESRVAFVTKILLVFSVIPCVLSSVISYSGKVEDVTKQEASKIENDPGTVVNPVSRRNFARLEDAAAHCASFISRTSCEFYDECLHALRPCTSSENSDEEYALSYGRRYCEAFLAVEPTLSEYGQLWSGSVRKCLQAKLVQDIGLWIHGSCVDLSRVAFDHHPDCYAFSEHSGCPSMSGLSVSDYATVIVIVKEYVALFGESCLVNRCDDLFDLPSL
jgi:hypothetical protein